MGTKTLNPWRAVERCQRLPFDRIGLEPPLRRVTADALWANRGFLGNGGLLSTGNPPRRGPPKGPAGYRPSGRTGVTSEVSPPSREGHGKPTLQSRDPRNDSHKPSLCKTMEVVVAIYFLPCSAIINRVMPLRPPLRPLEYERRERPERAKAHGQAWKPWNAGPAAFAWRRACWAPPAACAAIGRAGRVFGDQAGACTLIKRVPLDRMLADGEQRGGFRTVGRGAEASTRGGEGQDRPSTRTRVATGTTWAAL